MKLAIKSIAGSLRAANPFSFFKQSVFPAYLGVDIGTTSIKVVEVKQGRQLPKAVNYGFLEAGDYLGRSNSALQTSSLKLFDQDVAELLRLVAREMKAEAKEVLASIPVFNAFITALNFPEMNPAEVDKTVTFQARQYIPLPLSEVNLEWIKVGEFEDERGFKQQQILLISIPREYVEKYRRIFKSAGLHLRALEIESLSIARALVGSDPTPTVIIDVGSRSTNISFVEKGQLRFNSQSDFAGASLTQALASSLNINPRRAEELKREKGIVASGADYELSTIMVPFLDVIINEVKKADFAYRNQFPAATKIERAILSGGGANLRGMEKYFNRELGFPVVRATPFVKFEYPPILEPVVTELNPIFSVALGLTLGEFV